MSFFSRNMVVFLILLAGALTVGGGQAQTACGIANTVQPPIPSEQFQRVQGFGVPSLRHQGRYHTGEDWAAKEGDSYGYPVQSIAVGRVTYAYELGWGRDAGVIILEHTFKDGTVLYSMYGHIQPSDDYPFPAVDTCVTMGQIIGIIADVRPAPHLHFEMRSGNPLTPGPGYSWEKPLNLEWLNPSQTLTNQSARLHHAYRWDVAAFRLGKNPLANPAAPPLVLTDNSLLVIDGQSTKRVTRDGRILWRTNFDKDLVYIEGFVGQSLVHMADGTVQYIDADGDLGEFWKIDIGKDKLLIGAPLVIGNQLLYPAQSPSGKVWLLVDRARRNVEKVLPLPQDISQIHVSGDQQGFRLLVISSSNELQILNDNGETLYQAQLESRASVFPRSDGWLMYNRGGVWSINWDAQWTLVLANAPRGNNSRSIYQDENGLIYLFDGTRLHAYNGQELVWNSNLPPLTGSTSLSAYESVLVLLSQDGLLSLTTSRGVYCDSLQVYGAPASKQWLNLGRDSILRLAVGDSIFGIDWEKMTRLCVNA